MINKFIDAIKNGVFLWKTKKKIIETIQKKNNLLYIKAGTLYLPHHLNI